MQTSWIVKIIAMMGTARPVVPPIQNGKEVVPVFRDMNNFIECWGDFQAK